jgi:putative ABC transport system ATP-binding protein
VSRVIDAKAVSRDYVLASRTVSAVRSVDLQVESGTLVAIRGRSGSGKTTLLNLLGGLDKPTTGKVWLDGMDLTTATEADLVDVRRHKVGFIFQAFGLIPILSATENVQIPMRLTKTDVTEREERARILLELVGLRDRADHRPHELSGGEQQRVAIARALANDPQVLIADEPTGQLDSRTGRSIVDLVSALVHSENIAAVFATHDPAPIAVADQVLELSDGRLV